MNEKELLDAQVGRQIKTARIAAGYTQEQFAEMVGMVTTNISRIERGVVGVSLTSIRKICQTLSVTSDFLLMGESEDVDGDEMDFLFNRMRRLTPQQLEWVLSVNNKLFEAFALSDGQKK